MVNQKLSWGHIGIWWRKIVKKISLSTSLQYCKKNGINNANNSINLQMPREKPLLVSFSISFFFVVKFLRFCTFSHVVTASEHKEFRRPAFPSAIIAMSRILKGKTSWVKSHYLGQKFQIHGLFLWKLWYMDLIGRTRSNAGAWNVCNNWKMSIPLWRTSSKLYSRWVYTKEKKSFDFGLNRSASRSHHIFLLFFLFSNFLGYSLSNNY